MLDLDSLDSSGLSKLQEIGAALRDFRASGKRVVVGGRFARSDPVLPGGAGRRGVPRSDGDGVPRRLQLLPHVLKDAIDKLDVDVNVFRAGTFKSYTDQFSRSDMAPSEREESSVWLEALWNAYSQDVTRARSLPRRRAQ